MAILFSSPTCVPCKPVKQCIEENQLDVTIVDVSLDEGKAVAAQCGVRSTPTIVDGDTLYVGDTRCIYFLNQLLKAKA